jgi:hypothetical protein
LSLNPVTLQWLSSPSSSLVHEHSHSTMAFVTGIVICFSAHSLHKSNCQRHRPLFQTPVTPVWPLSLSPFIPLWFLSPASSRVHEPSNSTMALESGIVPCFSTQSHHYGPCPQHRPMSLSPFTPLRSPSSSLLPEPIHFTMIFIPDIVPCP